MLPLIASQGLLPVSLFLSQAEKLLGSRLSAFLQFPSVFWVNCSDYFLIAMSWVGVALSAALLLGFANGSLIIVLWVIYLSFVHIGQDWYSYGWEIQLLETGFLAIFLCPLLDGRPFPRRPPPVPVIWVFRWLIFGQERREIIFEGTDDEVVTLDSEWKAYEFKCKPGDPFRRPCVISPYYFRLDWQIWFAAMSGPDQYPWTLHFVWKLLHNDAEMLSLLANNPFPILHCFGSWLRMAGSPA